MKLYLTTFMNTLKEIKLDITHGKMLRYVYLLFKPDGTPFYVGKGMKNRVCAHESETRSFIKGKTWKGMNTFKLNTIKKIWDSDQQVYYAIDSWHNNNESAGNREIDLVLNIGRKILNQGPLVNIKDGGDYWSEELRQLHSKFMIQWRIDNPYTEEQKQHLSEMLIQYCEEHPEFIERLQLAKNEWIDQHPEEYAEAERKRLEICSSESHREKVSRIMKEYFSNNSEEYDRLVSQGKSYWIDNEEGREQARQRSINKKTHEHIINWLETKPEECRAKWDRHKDTMKEWHINNKEKYREIADKRNEKFRGEAHRNHMAGATHNYIKNNPEADSIRRAKAKDTHQRKKQIRLECLNLIGNRLVEKGLVKLPSHGKITEHLLRSWEKQGLFPVDVPSGFEKIEVWEDFKLLLVSDVR